MKNSGPRPGALLALALLAGCASMTDRGAGLQQGVSVARFHLGQPIARSEIRVEPAIPADANSLEFARTGASIERELVRLGWTLARGGTRTEQVAAMRVGQSRRPAERSRSAEIVVTDLGVRIQRRSDATVYWEGRAQLEARAGTPLADRRAAVDRLAAALFRDFPGESGRTIRIR
jgi:hypothetical protein